MPARYIAMCLLAVAALGAGTPSWAHSKFDPKKAATPPPIATPPEFTHVPFFYVNSSTLWEQPKGESIKSLQQAVDQSRSASAESLSSSLCSLGSMYADSGDTHNALSCFEQAAADIEKRLPKGGPDEAAIKHNIGEALEAQQAYELAEHHYQEAAQLFQNAGDTAAVARELDNLGQLYYLQHKLPEAEKTLKQCFAVRSANGDNGSTELLNTMEELSAVLEVEGKPAEATPLIIREGVLKDQLKVLGVKQLPPGFGTVVEHQKKGHK